MANKRVAKCTLAPNGTVSFRTNSNIDKITIWFVTYHSEYVHVYLTFSGECEIVTYFANGNANDFRASSHAPLQKLMTTIDANSFDVHMYVYIYVYVWFPPALKVRVLSIIDNWVLVMYIIRDEIVALSPHGGSPLTFLSYIFRTSFSRLIYFPRQSHALCMPSLDRFQPVFTCVFFSTRKSLANGRIHFRQCLRGVDKELSFFFLFYFAPSYGFRIWW